MADYEAIAIAYMIKPNNMTSLILAQYDKNDAMTKHLMNVYGFNIDCFAKCFVICI